MNRNRGKRTVTKNPEKKWQRNDREKGEELKKERKRGIKIIKVNTLQTRRGGKMEEQLYDEKCE